MLELAALYEPDALIDYVSIVIGAASLYFMLGLKKGRWRTLDHGGRHFVWGMIAFIASLIYERVVEPFGFHPFVDVHHVLMGAAMVFLALAATRSSPGKERIEREERHRASAERRLAESETTFQTLSERAPSGIFITDLEGNVTYANPALLSMLGKTVPQLNAHAWPKLYHPDDKRQLDRVQEAFARHAAFEGRFRLMRASGAYGWVHVTLAPVRAGGRMQWFTGTVTDIDDLLLKQHELESQRDSMKKSVDLLVGRERKMIELKREIERLRGRKE